MTKSLAIRLEFTLLKGTHSLKLYIIYDSYVGADHDSGLEPVGVLEGLKERRVIGRGYG